jgi:hypothetical protein
MLLTQRAGEVCPWKGIIRLSLDMRNKAHSIPNQIPQSALPSPKELRSGWMCFRPIVRIRVALFCCKVFGSVPAPPLFKPFVKEKGPLGRVSSLVASISIGPRVLDRTGQDCGLWQGPGVGWMLACCVVYRNEPRTWTGRRTPLDICHLPLRFRALLETLTPKNLGWEAPHFHPNSANL